MSSRKSKDDRKITGITEEASEGGNIGRKKDNLNRAKWKDGVQAIVEKMG